MRISSSHGTSSAGHWKAVFGLSLFFAITYHAPPPIQAQNPVDPSNSWVELLCPENAILTLGWEDPLGDAGVVVHCYDVDGLPIQGISPDAFSLVLPPDELNGSAVALASAPTDEAGRTLLTAPLVGSAVSFGGAAIGVTVGGETIVIDNGGAGIPLQLRSPDLNLDLTVDLSDIVLFSSEYDLCDGAPRAADLDGNGCVDVADLAIMAGSIGIGPPLDTGAPSLSKQQSTTTFAGCLQRDFDEDGDPATLRNEIVAIAGIPFELDLVAADFTTLTGFDVTLDLPADVTFLGVSMAGPTTIVNVVSQSETRVRVAGGSPCSSQGPVFLCSLSLIRTTTGPVQTELFSVVDARFSDCFYPPRVYEACVGSPTPCDLSTMVQGVNPFVTCPGADLAVDDLIVVTLRDQQGQGVPGLPASEFRLTLTDELGSNLADMFELVPLAELTDASGELPYRFQAREACRWDGCFDLRIDFNFEGCELSLGKTVRTLNVHPYELDPPGSQTDVINQADVDLLGNMSYTVDQCLDAQAAFRCPVVTSELIALIGAHLGHACSVVATDPVVSVADAWLENNYPNPFNPSTRIIVSLPSASMETRLDLYDARGRWIRSLFEGALPDGSSTFEWDGRDALGVPVASGVYHIALRALGRTSTTKLVVLR